MNKYYIGVDAGGSKTHAILFNSNFKQIDEAYSGSANIRISEAGAYLAISCVIDELISKHKITNVKIGIGVAGYSVISNRERLQQRLNEKYKSCIIQSDCHIACLAAHNRCDGAVVICGTGVVGYVIKNNTYTQIGGWGFPHGDLGGASYLGLEACKLICKAIDKVIGWSPLLKHIYNKFGGEPQKFKNWLLTATPGDFAKAASLMLSSYSNDIYAEAIFNDGVSEMRQFTKAIADASTGYPLKLVGGLAHIYYEALLEVVPNLELCEITPAIGAIYMVM